jgi:hypothetical protein
MRHQDRQGRICQDVPGGSAENHLSQPALGIGALDQQVTLQRRRVRQDGLAGGSAPQFVERREAKYSPRGFVRWSIVSFVRSRAESADKMNRKFIRAE